MSINKLPITKLFIIGHQLSTTKDTPTNQKPNNYDIGNSSFYTFTNTHYCNSYYNFCVIISITLVSFYQFSLKSIHDCIPHVPGIPIKNE